MTNDNDIRHGRHCIFLMHVHLQEELPEHPEEAPWRSDVAAQPLRRWPGGALSKLSSDALNNSRRHVKARGGLPSALSFTFLTGACTEGQAEKRIGAGGNSSGIADVACAG